MRYQLLACVIALLLLALPAASGEKPGLGTPEIKMTGDTIEDAELTVTVTIAGESITKALLYIQSCSGDSCNMPVEVEMESIGPGQYRGTYSEFEAGLDYYQYMVKAENAEGESNMTDFVKIKGLPGYEDNGTDDDDTTPEDDTDENDGEDSPGFGPAMVLAAVVLLGVVFRGRYY